MFTRAGSAHSERAVVSAVSLVAGKESATLRWQRAPSEGWAPLRCSHWVIGPAPLATDVAPAVPTPGCGKHNRAAAPIQDTNSYSIWFRLPIMLVYVF